MRGRGLGRGRSPLPVKKIYSSIAYRRSTASTILFLVCTGAKVPQLKKLKLKGTKVVCGAKVPRVRKFHGTKVWEHSLLRSESSTGAKVPWNESSCTFRSPGANVPRNESSTGAKVQRNEKASYPFACTFAFYTCLLSHFRILYQPTRHNA